jgi:epoxide hydrolase-like predicted phosphatase
MALQAVIFDIGGVLVDADLESYANLAAPVFGATVDNLRAAVQANIVALETGKIDTAKFWESVGLQLDKSQKGFKARPSDTVQIWRQALVQRFKINQKLLDLCWSLQSKGLVVGALSNTIRDHAEYLAAKGVYQPFKPLLLSCEVGLRKPDPAIYKLCIQKVGKAAKDCLFVDDSQTNIDAAKKAGMQTHLYSNLAAFVTDLKSKLP